LASLNEADAAAVRSALEPGVMDTYDIRVILAANGHPVSSNHLMRHKRTVARRFGLVRNGVGCSCP
jgi:hypothetical protein